MTNLWLDHDPDGSGPTVVFLPGAGLVGRDFRAAQRLTAPAVIYDRAGTGWSEPTALPRSATAVAEELRAALTTAGVTGPVILAGHSLGAFYARRYAQLFPTEVAGLLLIDPGHEDIFDFLPPRRRRWMPRSSGRPPTCRSSPTSRWQPPGASTPSSMPRGRRTSGRR
ncbi:hypothetical protein Ais01nite_58590 [Asanoa ishikariensis]|uniref:alpha/beta fold hydrolase n=1 Tax=Asanoa ishikariensis TaxID=137265 RepID=UPI000AC87AAF|nr:alpha/beta hydrolase [Asanoa ishikariensis]GIF67824.1 hypothetical protein Ais01nite_58590 [Asanoa ishikariensis]